MNVLSSRMSEYLDQSSWIRRMFEAGTELKKIHGPDRVYDFSLGNPDLPPPESVGKGLEQLARETQSPYALGYMPNAGYPHVRQTIAEWAGPSQEASLGAEDVLLTCGAAGGLNCIFKALLEPGEEVVCPAPYFVEYFFYAQNHGGVLRPVPAAKDDFGLDVPAMAEAISEKTRIVLINSPNNPTGRIYDTRELQELAEVLRTASRKQNRPIYLVSDEPYRFLTYDGATVSPIFPLYGPSIVANSFSKSLSLAGERIGYLLLNPEMPDKSTLMDGLVLANRILGFVNAPAIGQRLVEQTIASEVDVGIFEHRRKLMCEVLDQAGYSYVPPQGGFYFFPAAPGGDDVAFVQALQEERILAVPGSGFGFPGHFRLSCCVPEEVIRNSGPGFARAAGK
ncbi:pyridoxal phosphate-dependent aminotransferase [Desulfovermiculus halophilus]|uniref:pyridoxal phosphate-dependent aminotransferase n=1 Tax=Desulfovermiculus halophilus TaxID=339722 RepID=UPI00048458AB|nr:pyridoxal phosphate-dependent aminotransferase [Desulfovermiculus halophilus]